MSMSMRFRSRNKLAGMALASAALTVCLAVGVDRAAAFRGGFGGFHGGGGGGFHGGGFHGGGFGGFHGGGFGGFHGHFAAMHNGFGERHEGFGERHEGFGERHEGFRNRRGFFGGLGFGYYGYPYGLDYNYPDYGYYY